MTSARQFTSSKRWFSDLRRVLKNLETCLEDVDALCDASLDDTGGEWLCEMMLCRLELRAAVAHPRQILRSRHPAGLVRDAATGVVARHARPRPSARRVTATIYARRRPAGHGRPLSLPASLPPIRFLGPATPPLTHGTRS
jgi:hypothetical protein